jgi:hypothetical protein
MAAAPAHPPSEDAELLRAAARLCAEAGLPPPSALSRLAGGKNNRVFRLDLEDGSPRVLKSYFRHESDPRDRLGAEWGFLTFAWARGVRAAPEPIACDRAEGLGLYSFVPGGKLAADAITAAHVEAAAGFVAAVNAPPRRTAALAPGSEACFSIADHLGRIGSRVARLARLDPGAPHLEQAVAVVDDVLRPTWDRVRDRVADACAASGVTQHQPLPDAEIIASPSDFGFHNALWADGRGLAFLDFEYAGRDDPAKLAGDFFGCPEIPTPPEHFALFADTLAERLKLPEPARLRMDLLRDAYRIKWACIILNDFLPTDDARRRFAEQGDRAARCAGQLAKARAKLKEVGA